MDKNLQELIQYKSSIDKPCAADILCSMQQVQTSLNKVLAHFKEKIKLEVVRTTLHFSCQARPAGSARWESIQGCSLFLKKTIMSW
jgi:hypothetical protein